MERQFGKHPDSSNSYKTYSADAKRAKPCSTRFDIFVLIWFQS